MNISSILSSDSNLNSPVTEVSNGGGAIGNELGGKGIQASNNMRSDNTKAESNLHTTGFSSSQYDGDGSSKFKTLGGDFEHKQLANKQRQPRLSSVLSEEEDIGDSVDEILAEDNDGVSQNYLWNFERKVNAINQLDEIALKANALQILHQEEQYMKNLIEKTEELSQNYVERVVTEDLSSNASILDGTTSIGRDFRWGSTRDIKKHEYEDVDLDSLVDKSKHPSKKNASKSKTKKIDESVKNIADPKKKTKQKRKQPATDEVTEDYAGKKRKTRSDVALNPGDERPSKSRAKSKLSIIGDENEADEVSNIVDGKTVNMSTKEQKFITKQYENVFVAIWKDLSRKDGPKVSRLMQQSTQAKLINLKKTSILAAREAKRWQLRNNKNQKDLVTKARRAMREMFNFWKRNERIERELKKKHEKELIDKAKKEEEERESRRQSRKLNFLITQTELYSHFIGKKIKTDKFEGQNSDPLIAFKQDNNNLDKYVDIKHNGTATDFKNIDFDNEEDEALSKAAAVNAQIALEQARAKAQTFDNNEPLNNPDTNGEEMNFQNPTMIGDINISQPKMLNCTLKEYQVKGLNWLANLYEQGINGILADEMGLGKTVQSISVLSYLAETHNIWGPFLIVTPASTLHNWQQEISRFVPDFKVIPYWGNAKDRKILRRYWDRKNVRYTKDSPFHVLVTSYQLVVTDAAYFQKMRWQYMILDEAQAIKSSQSTRWKSLLSFSCRNRLLLTGTPIQNNMQELWALLHFIMPSLFDSHDEFSDWFSKDIESHAQSNTKVNEQQLRRLHVILKPFMLRRIKKNVQSELGDKVEVDLFCNLTNRQKKYYQMLKSQISIMDLLDSTNNSNDDNAQSLMNLVMQFRKVCNHPDLFERADVKSSFSMTSFAETGSFLRETNDLELHYTTKNLIKYKLPKLIYDELLLPSFKNDIVTKNDEILKRFNIYDPSNILDDDKQNFRFLRFVDTSAGELNKLTKQNIFERAIEHAQYTSKNYEGASRYKYCYEDSYLPASKLFLINEYENNFSAVYNSIYLKEMYSIRDKLYEDMVINVMKPAAEPAASVPPVDIECSSRSFIYDLEDTLFNPAIRSALMPMPFNCELELIKSNVAVENFPKSNLLPSPINKFIDYSNVRMPSMNRFIKESGKLSRLDELLYELKRDGHRVLIYFQMTKMMDLMEEYLTFRQHKYIRLDGSSKLDDRRDLVHDWQTKPELFVFLLSTRAGGLGINLTAADTVIFYDSDWNPTIDSQAMDRAHRLGQTRQVTVYRLLTRGSIEEKMRDRAKQKEQVQQVVMEGKATAVGKKDDGAVKKKDVAYLLLGNDDDSSASPNATDA